MTEKQYPELPEPTAWRSYDNLLKRARYNAMPITSMQPGIYSHTRMFTEDQMRAYVDADRAMRAAQAGPSHQLICAVDDWFSKNTGLGGCSDNDVTELAAIFATIQPANQPAAPASQDAARYRGLRDLAKERLLYPQRAASELAADMRTHWELPVLICSGPIGGYRDFDSAVDRAIDAARAKQDGK